MASNITAAGSASFNTSNMKVASGEQLDALHMQNMADNTGHVYFREEALPIISGGMGFPLSSLWYKRASHNAVRAVFSSSGSLGAITSYLRIYSVNQEPDVDTPVLEHSVTQSVSADTAYTLELDISSLTNGNLYCARVLHSTSFSGNTNPAGIWLIHTTAATY